MSEISLIKARVKELCRQWKSSEALNYIEELEESLRQDSGILTLTALLGYKNGNIDLALTCLKQACLRDQDNIEAHLALIALHCDLGNYSKAEKLHKKLYLRYPDRSGLERDLHASALAGQHEAQGDFYLGLGLHSEALKAYRLAIRLQEPEAGLWQKSIACELSNQQTSPQVKEFPKTKAFARVHIQNGLGHWRARRYREAIRTWELAFQLAPADPQTQAYLQIAQSFENSLKSSEFHEEDQV